MPSSFPPPLRHPRLLTLAVAVALLGSAAQATTVTQSTTVTPAAAPGTTHPPVAMPAAAPAPAEVTGASAAVAAPVNSATSAPVAPAAVVTASSAAEPPRESSLIGVVSELPVEAPPTDLWDRIRAGYTMPDLEDPLVAKWEKFYADRPDYLARIVDRSSKYMFYIVTEIERRGMPLEIALLPMIESAFNPVAHSSAKAAGIWQFIPSTGVNYGMKQDWWADSRRDIVAATNGALEYLSRLNGMFNDWQLALASYNWGEGSVGRAVARAKAAGKDGTYLSLDMPAETRNYLPKLQAVKNIIRNPAAYGVTIASIANEPYFKTITLAHPIDLKRAAQLAEMTEAEFVALNPAHNRPVIGGRGEFQMLLPADKADHFLARLDANEKPRVSWMAYRTRTGDRIEALAQRFGTSVAAIKSVNGIRAVSPVLPAGYNLLVPSDGPSDEALGSIQNAVFTKFPEYVAPRSHKVRRGETFAGIAKRYGVKPATLAQWNRMSKQSARAGQVLYVSGPAPVRASGKGGRVMYVKKGGKTVRVVSGQAKRGAVAKAGKGKPGKQVVKRRR
ncbi:MAG: transglycosylase SLT domain-containing protein [Burkholderiales bacterium]|nr:transglycosylase SLT domain-containing protein [Burkholderiales bacterium]